MHIEKKTKTIIRLCVIATIAALGAMVFLTACAKGLFEPLPQKVTINNIPVEPTPLETTEPTQTPEPLETPDAAEQDTAQSMSSESTNMSASATEIPVLTPQPSILQQVQAQTQTNDPDHVPMMPLEISEEERTGVNGEKAREVVKAANHRLDTGYYSRQTLIDGLIEDGFTPEEAAYGADNCYIHWG